MRLVGVACIGVNLFGLLAQGVESACQHGVLGFVVAAHVGLCRINLRQSGIVHQVGQLGFIVQLGPARHQLVSLGPALILVGLHLRHQRVVLGQR